MCVIVVQDKQKFPGWDMLQKCWFTNPHGAGVMYRTKEGRVHIEKGFMTFEDYKNYISALNDYQIRPMVYHFRIATHGTVSEENTHPFPISSKVPHMMALSVLSDAGVAHNGVINYKSYNHSLRMKNNLTDTGAFLIKNYLRAKNGNKISKKAFINGLKEENKISNSRFALMDGTDIIRVGTWYEFNGCYYSNNIVLPNRSFKSYDPCIID